MGIVYLADDIRLSRRVALKAITPGYQADNRRRERLRREARAAAAISYPGIATVYAIEEIDGELYLATEYVSGPTLRALVARGPLPLADVVDIAAQLARALEVAHAAGIVHRDVKPENVVRTAAGVVKILDFGVARLDSLSGPSLTGIDAAVGTAAYMAPEQLRHDEVDFRTDLFALGVLVYEIAAGANPFEAETATASMARILETNPPPLSTVAGEGSIVLDHIVATCLRKSRNERYASTTTLISDLERFQAQLARERSASYPQPFEEATSPDQSTSPRTTRPWWEIHQIVVSAVYALMIYPAWRARIWLPAPWNSLFFLAIVAAAVVTVAVRLHLVFAARSYPTELSTQRTRTRAWRRASDTLLSASLFFAALALASDHSEVAALLLTVSVAAMVSMLVIEPATDHAAFGNPTPRSQTDGVPARR
jgi:serine/threonine protein kinase